MDHTLFMRSILVRTWEQFHCHFRCEAVSSFHIASELHTSKSFECGSGEFCFIGVAAPACTRFALQ